MSRSQFRLTGGEIFDARDLERVEELASGLSEEEVLSYFYLTPEDLPPEDARLFKLAFSRGRVTGKAKAVHHLFNSMQSKEGTKASLSYLVRFGQEWPVVDEVNGVKAKDVDASRTFRILLDKE
jgi:hypothetical protein